MTGAAGGLAGGLWAAHGAVLEAGRAVRPRRAGLQRRACAPSRCVITGEGRLDEQTLQGKIVGEIGTRTRQAGVPLHAIVGRNAIDLFGMRMIDLQVVRRRRRSDADRGLPPRPADRRPGDRRRTRR